MMNPEKQKELRSLFIDGLQFQKEKRNRLSALPNEVSPGELFLFPIDVVVKWCATFTHSKDDDLWYIVPGDEFPEVGTRDVVLPDSCDEAPLVFRCGNGIWVHVNDFDFDQRIGQIDRQLVEQIRDHLGRIVKNDLPTVDSLVETDDDPDYIEWVEELSSAVQNFEQALLNSENVSSVGLDQKILPLSAFRERRPDELGDLISSSTYSLAAESKNKYTVEQSDGKSLSAEVPFDTDGKVFAVRYERGVVVLAFGFDESPPEIMVGDRETAAIQWHQGADGFTSSLLPFENNLVVLSFEERSFVVEKMAK